MVSKPKKRRIKIPLGAEQKVGAVVDAALYNELVDFSEAMDQDFAWLVRAALKKFVTDHRQALGDDALQLSLDLATL